MDDSTTQKLVERDVTTWQALIHEVVRDDAFEPNGALAQRLLEQRDEISEWVAFAHETIEEDDRLFTKSTPRRRFEARFIRSSLEVLPAGDEELFDLRFRLLTIDPTFDGGLAQAIALLEDLAASPQPVDPEFIAEVCLLAVKGAFTHHDWAKAASYAQMASRGFRASQNEDRYRFSQRRLGAAKIGVGELQAGFEIFDEALTAPGPLFGGGGVTIFSPAETERDEAVHEMEATSAWATLWTPEYVRAIGGLAERWDDGAQRAWLWDRFASALGAMFDASEIAISKSTVAITTPTAA